MSENLQNVFPKARLDAMFELAKHAGSLPITADMPSWARTDSQDALYVSRQLEEIRQGLYEVQYAPLKAQRLMPWNTHFDPGLEQYTVRSVDRAGRPVAIKGSETSIPTLAMTVKSATMNFHSFALAYEYTEQEIAAAKFAKVALSQMKAMYTAERLRRLLDEIAFMGDTSLVTDCIGLFNQAGTVSYVPTTLGTGGTKNFENKSSDQILFDMNGALNLVVTNSAEVEECDTLLLPITSQTLINQIRVGDGTSSTILAYFKSNNPGITVDRSNFLETAGAGSVKRMVGYRNDPLRVEMCVSVLFAQQAPQFVGYAAKTNCMVRTGGVALYLPKSVVYADGV